MLNSRIKSTFHLGLVNCSLCLFHEEKQKKVLNLPEHEWRGLGRTMSEGHTEYRESFSK